MTFEDAHLLRHEVRINTKATLVEQYNALDEQLEAMLLAHAEAPKPKQRVATVKTETPPEAVALAEQLEALEAQMADSWVTLTLEAMPGPEWAAFKGDHPPKGGADDERCGVSLAAVIRDLPNRCVDCPWTDDEWDAALNRNGIWPGDQRVLAMTVVGMHAMGFNIPKSRLVSAVRQNFEGADEQLASSASPGAATPAGSRRRGTTTTPLTGT